ncbi:MAG: T9SS type A sorting domain-containing protein [Chitinophagaceae bacterium]|nr:T9SS type A sorting domain-containing protein [Chitinophagaceae bacterium]
MKNTFISKLVTLCALTLVSTNLQAQFDGGNGRGDNRAELVTCNTLEVPTTVGNYQFTLNHTDGLVGDYSAHFLSGNCRALASITDAAGGNVLGSTTVSMDLYASAFNSATTRSFVPRVVNITPTSNGTATVVLYYTQADFNAYNANLSFQKSLPVNSADTANFKSNLKMFKSATASYETSNLTPVSSSVSWNATNNLWEVTMSGVSVSGYYFVSTDFVTTLTASPITHTQTTPLTNDNVARVTVDWPNVAGATSYNVRYRLVGSPTWNPVSNTAISQITYSNLTFGSSYEVQVQVKVNNQVQGEYTPIYTFTAPSALPLCVPPATMGHNVTSNQSVTFNWSASTYGVLYQVQVREKGFVYWGGTSTAALSRTFNALKGSTDYEYEIRTKCLLNATRNQWSAFTSIAKFTTLPDPPTVTCLPPTNIYTTINNANSVTINWDTASNADFYSVRIQKAGDTLWGGTSTTLNSTTFNSLSQNTKYYFKVRTKCLANTTINANSEFTVVDSFTTPYIKPTPSLIFNDINAGWSVYPNPTQDVVNVQFVSPEDATITINLMDMTGRLVKTVTASAIMGSNLIDVNMSEFVNGVYTLHVIQNDKLKYVTKVNKQN